MLTYLALSTGNPPVMSCDVSVSIDSRCLFTHSAFIELDIKPALTSRSCLVRARVAAPPGAPIRNELKCAIDTLLVLWAGHFHCQNIHINIRTQFYQAALGNYYGLKLAQKC